MSGVKIADIKNTLQFTVAEYNAKNMIKRENHMGL